jgi:osmotically-inducible protein OsmY
VGTAGKKIARAVAGVRAIVNDIIVNVPPSMVHDDARIAKAAVEALNLHLATSNASITPVVRDGWISLSGASGPPNSRDVHDGLTAGLCVSPGHARVPSIG